MTPISKVDFGQLEKQPLAGQVALVTGGSRGIGRAIALRLASQGCAIAICGRDRNALHAVEEELRSQLTGVFAQTADITSSSDVEALVGNAESRLGPITILVNNAGIGVFGAAHEKSETDWDRVLNTNLKSVFLVSRAVVPSMIRHGRGDIINISSLAGKNAFAGGGLYCASKWGVRGLTACMAEDLREHNIRVAAIFPGSVATEFSGRGPKDATKALTPDDVAHAVVMLVTQGPQSFLSEVDLRPLRKA
ncbi:MAG TPA: SDR family NAD(P)-dependent oxidoreductase [Candidatus Sulfotelmatobacter sp.]|nr:SDR family NAD(P)-dependent oxidoreductase [Candidatus Sulfotelmatobacter sp.]